MLRIQLSRVPVARNLVPNYGPNKLFVTRGIRPFFYSLCFRPFCRSKLRHFFFSGLLVSIGSFQAWNFEFRIISKNGLFPDPVPMAFLFFKYNNNDMGMEVRTAIKIIEVCLYLFALFPGKDWGTSLILSLLASFWSLDKVIVNIFECQEIFSLAEMPLIWLIWIGLLWTLHSIISQNRRHSTTKRFWALPRKIGFSFLEREVFICQLKLRLPPSGQLANT